MAKRVSFKKDEYIIKSGEMGMNFFIVDEGSVIAIKEKEGQPPKILYEYSSGEYFGELSLISNKKRTVTVKATSNSRLYKISKDDFENMIGPLNNLSDKNESRYAKYI